MCAQPHGTGHIVVALLGMIIVSAADHAMVRQMERHQVKHHIWVMDVSSRVALDLEWRLGREVIIRAALLSISNAAIVRQVQRVSRSQSYEKRARRRRSYAPSSPVS